MGFEKKADGLLPILKQQGLFEEDEIEARLELSDAGVGVFFPKYNVLVNLTFNDNGKNSCA